MSLSISANASSIAGPGDQVGISVLKKQLDLQAGQNTQLLASIPSAPRPQGNTIDLYA